MLGERLDGVGVPGDHHGAGTVHGGDTGAARMGGQHRGHLRLGRLHGEHRAAGRQRLHERATRGDQRHRLVEGHHAGHVRGGELADRVAEQEVGSYAPGLQEAEQGHLVREQGDLGVPGLVDPLVRHDLRPLGDRVVGAGEHGEPLVEIRGHARRLRPLAGEQYGGAAGCGYAPYQLRGGATGSERVERGQGGQPVRGQHDGAVLQVGAGGGGRVRDTGQVQTGVGAEEGAQPGPLRGERGGGAPGHQQGYGTRQHRRGGGPRHGLHGWRLLDDRVRVRTADAERRDGGAPGPPGLRPRPRLGEQLDAAGRPRNVGVGGVDVQRPRYDAVPHRLHHLDDPGDARGGLGVPDVRLERAEQQRPARGPVLSVCRPQRVGLDGVTEHGAGAVALDHVDVVRQQLRPGERRPDDALLRGAVRGGQAVGGAVLVDRAAADQREHLVPEAPRVGQLLDQQQGHALGPPGAVRARGEGLAPPVRREPALTGELGEHARGGDDRDAAGQRHRALVVPQRLHGEVQRHQRRGARGVDRDGRTLQPQRVGDPAGDDAVGAAGEQVTGDLRMAGAEAVPGGGRADEDTGAAAVQRLRVDRRVLDGFPGGLQQEPLLRVHRERLTRGDAEQARVERVGVVHKTAEPRVRSVGVVPSPVLRERADRVDAAGDEAPQVGGRGDAAGQPAAHADDGDRLPGGLPEHTVLLAQPFGLLQRGAQRFDRFLRAVAHRCPPGLVRLTRRRSPGDRGSAGRDPPG
ncbi:hypothetical protein GCM10010435_24090 [Winogradskya consettensis]